MFFNPSKLFFLSPTPSNRRDSPIVAGNEKPVLRSTTDSEVESARVIDPHGDRDKRWPEKTQSRIGCLGFRHADAAIAAPAAAAPAVTVNATAETENLEDDVASGGLGSEGWENEKGKRNETIVFVC